MITKLDAFLSEVLNMPGFVAASAANPKWIGELEGIERALLAVDRLANDDPAMIDLFDKIQDVIGRSDISTKAKLLEVAKILVQVRDAMKMIH
jgi:hypothetical protein